MGNDITIRGARSSQYPLRTSEVGGVHTPHVIPAGYDVADDMLKVKSVQKKFRDSFSGSALDTDKWSVESLGAGMAISVADNALTITSGTANSETVLLANEVFTLPLRAMIGYKMSQRIARQHVAVELVSVDPDTGVPDNMGIASLVLCGTSATSAVYGVRSGAGSPTLLSAPSTVVSSSTFSILELEPFSDEMYFHSRAMDSTAGRSNSYVRHQQIPDPTLTYKLRIRVKNRGLMPITAAVAGTGGVVRLSSSNHGLTTGEQVIVTRVNGVPAANGTYLATVVDVNSFDLQGTVFSGTFVADGYAVAETTAAPASSTAFTLQFAGVIDYAELTAEITAGRGQSAVGQAMAMQVVNSPTLANAVNNPVGVVQRGGLYSSLSATALAANATFTSSVMSSFSTSYSELRDTLLAVTVSHNAGVAAQHGTLFIETYETSSTTTPSSGQRVTYSVAVPSDGLPHTFVFPITTKYFRVNFRNGGTATQTAFSLAMAQLAPGALPFIPDSNVPFLLSVTNLASSSTFTSATFDFGTSRTYQTIDLVSNSAQSGVLALEQSWDGATWLRTHSFVAAANAVVVGEGLPICMRYCRVVYVNDATAQTSFRLHATIK